MIRVLRMESLVVAAACLCAPTIAQAISWHPTWSACIAKAKASARPIFLLVVGTQWDAQSKAFQDKIIGHAEVQEVVSQNFEAYRIDLVLKEDRKAPPVAGEETQKLLQKLALYGHLGLPRVILMDPNERIYGRTGPMGDHDRFVESLADWETAHQATLKPVRSEDEAARYCADATAARNLKKPVQALEAAKRAVDANPRSPLAHFCCGLGYTDQGQHDKARPFYLAALSLDSTGDPENATSTTWAAGSWYNLAIGALNQGKEAAAIFYLRENQRTDHSTDAPMLRIAELHIKASRPDLALEEYGELLSRNGLAPDWIATYLDLQASVFKGK